MFMDIPHTWLQSLSYNDFTEIFGITVVLSLSAFLLNLFFVLLIRKWTVLTLTPISVIFVMGILLYSKAGDWNYARTEGLSDLKAHGFVIPRDKAATIFSLTSDDKRLSTYGVGASSQRKLKDITGDVHLISTTKDYHYSIYFTVDGQNDGNGKPAVWRTSTVDVLTKYGEIIQNDGKVQKENEVEKVKSDQSFENSHKLN